VTRQVSVDRHTAYDVVFLDLPADDSPRALPGLRSAIRTDLPGLEVGLAGGPAFYGDVQEVSESDLRRSEVISLPLAGLALLIVFGSVVAAALPLAIGGAAVVVALAGIFLAVVRVAYESLYAAWAAHAAWNWIMAVPFHASVSGIAFDAPDYRTVSSGPAWATGGAWGPEGGVAAAVSMLAGLFYLYRSRRRREELYRARRRRAEA
jgi:hypothetical protein